MKFFIADYSMHYVSQLLHFLLLNEEIIMKDNQLLVQSKSPARADTISIRVKKVKNIKRKICMHTAFT